MYSLKGVGGMYNGRRRVGNVSLGKGARDASVICHVINGSVCDPNMFTARSIYFRPVCYETQRGLK